MQPILYPTVPIMCVIGGLCAGTRSHWEVYRKANKANKANKASGSKRQASFFRPLAQQSNHEFIKAKNGSKNQG
jgi:hypothetical protein